MYGFSTYATLPYAGQMAAASPTATVAVSSWTAKRPALVLRSAATAWTAVAPHLPSPTSWGFGNFGQLAVAEIAQGTPGALTAVHAILTWVANSPRLPLRSPPATSTWVARGITSFLLSAETLEVLTAASGHANLDLSQEVLEALAAPTDSNLALSAEVLEVLAQPTSTANLDLSAEILEVAAAPTGAQLVDSAEILEVLVAWPGIAVGVCRSQLM